MGIKEIAELAGVSKTTVSLALNGHKGVSPETRMQILALAKKLDYRVPGERAVALPSQGFVMFARLKKHGLILNHDQSSFIMDYMDSINHVVCDSGYIFEIFDYRFEFMEQCVEEIQNRQPKGVVVLGTELSEEDVSQLSKLTIPYVVLDTYFDQIPCDFIDMANITAVFALVTYLYENGHRQIGMVTSTIKSGNILMRERGFEQALRAKGLSFDDEALFNVEPGFQGAYSTMKELLLSHRALPQALFCYNDVAAFGVMKALKEAGYVIPRDISIIGFDDLPMSSMMDPHLTSIKVPNKQIGRMAAQALLEKLSAKKVYEPVCTLVHGSLMIRDTVMHRT
ncbi:MAG: LacI family transcriptional regulator [Sphaerochaeta sp.]|jgi:LacI family transcriptional regulator|uniref:LacI family DNA-binding transcriptional regulator n=1 Tax=Sphaerochaeta sp. TaxID=1972642 RepID=UPI002635883E|nr:LacI family DNA-binding transcriptional regulator [Sphaerochaeta sp.]MCK9597934.1 LacI family transcriptional regulator [Sphaerochaeta sp.]MDX9824388.1 LacI family DNA-binding transcriptional regulator [Sphaerochaeta sp.]